MNGVESEIVNDVFTILEHPSKSAQKLSESDRLCKKETLFEAHVRAGLVKLISVTIPASGNTYQKIIDFIKINCLV